MHLLFRVILLRNEYYFETGKASPVIFDCGANIGLATLFFKWLYPGKRDLCVRARQETFALLKRNVEVNHLTGVHLYNVALSDESGTAYLLCGPCQSRISSDEPELQRMPKDAITVETLTLSEIIRRQLPETTRLSEA